MLYMDDIIGALLVIIPVVVVIAFIVSGIFYKKAKKTAAVTGKAEDIEKMQTFRAVFRVSGIIIAVLVITAAVLGILFYWFIQNM